MLRKSVVESHEIIAVARQLSFIFVKFFVFIKIKAKVVRFYENIYIYRRSKRMPLNFEWGTLVGYYLKHTVISQHILVRVRCNKLGLIYLNLALKDSDDCVFIIIIDISDHVRRPRLITQDAVLDATSF